MSMNQRLNKFIAQSGICSRRKADELILQGKVMVNGRPPAGAGMRINPHKDRVSVNGRSLSAQGPVYIMLHKPKGYITTTKDAHAEKTVLELLPRLPVRLYPVGRLDKNTSGLLILTNDGPLSYRLTHPKFEIKRVYEVRIAGFLPDEVIRKIEAGGLRIEDHLTAPCRIRVIRRRSAETTIQISLHEGRKRQIRILFDAFQCPVRELKRVQFGKLKLGRLREGQWQYIRRENLL